MEKESRRISYTEQREREKMIRRAEKKLKETEERISEIEKAIGEIEEKIAAGEIAGDIFEQHAALQKKLEYTMSEWEIAGEELEQFKNNK